MFLSSGRARASLALAMGVALAISVAVPQSATALETSETDYIIQVPEGQQDQLLDTLSQLGVSPEFVYDNALNGVAVSLNPSELSAVTSEISGDIVVPDLPVELMTTQAPAPWNLAMIDSALRPSDQAFMYPESAGAGVRVYVIDTGIVTNNSQLAGRVLSGKSYVDADPSTEDCNGHGTHVAGTIASSTYGVAKSASVVPIRVFNCNGTGGTVSKILDGIDWAIADKPVGTVGVINMSLGVRCAAYCSNYPLVTAVQKAVAANFVVAVSAGNAGSDAAFFAPAAAPSALTVGAVDQFDRESSWSNYGVCVDLYAPGVDVPSLNAFNSASTATMSGTSMASPHVAGVAALLIASNPGENAVSISRAIKISASNSGVIQAPNHNGSPNAQLVISEISSNAGIGLTPPAPSGLKATNVDLSTIDVGWSAVNPCVEASDYVLSYRAFGDTTWTTTSAAPSLGTSERLTGLRRDTNYEIRVSTKTEAVGPSSTSIFVRTQSGIPEQPSGLAAGQIQATSVGLSWTPAQAHGSSISDYKVQYRPIGSAKWLPFADPISPTPVATVTGLAPLQSTEFRVRAVTLFGEGPWSSSIQVSTLSGIPRAPSGVSAISGSPTNLAVTWGASPTNGASVQDYVVEYRRFNDSIWKTWNDGVSPLLSTAITGLTAGTSYVVRVSAKSQFGTGPSTVAAPAITLNGRPLKVASLTAQQSSSSAVLSWAAASPNGSPVTDYVVDYRPASVSSWTRFSDGVSLATTATVTGLAPGVSYYFRVMAVSAYGTGSGLVTSVRMVP